MGIARFKFQNDSYSGEVLAGLMAEFAKKESLDLDWVDVMTAVPLHPIKRRERGFNQVDILCKRLSKDLGVTYQEEVLRRTRHTTPQSRLSINERRQNIKDAFVAKDCEGMHILLVDDIFTTGSTANACAKALYRAGAKEVRVLCLSVVQDGSDG